MNKRTDRDHLMEHQYKDSSNLKGRAQLHERFSISKDSWHNWIFDHFAFSESDRILDVGSGPAVLWKRNLHRVSEGWEVVLADFSPGMLLGARRDLRSSAHRFRFGVMDAQEVPFVDETFDVVMANHMLYHVPDRARALSEFWRVLKREGRFYASTNGRNNMKEMKDIVKRVDPMVYERSPLDGFTLENGRKQIAEWFQEVEIHERDDGLVVPEVEPLFAYVHSSGRLDKTKGAELRKLIEEEIASNGPIHIAKAGGLFAARKRYSEV